MFTQIARYDIIRPRTHKLRPLKMILFRTYNCRWKVLSYPVQSENILVIRRLVGSLPFQFQPSRFLQHYFLFCFLSQFSPVRSLDRGTIQQRSSSSLFLQEAVVSSSGIGRDAHSLMFSSSISSADHSVAHLPRCPEGWFWRGCRGV